MLKFYRSGLQLGVFMSSIVFICYMPESNVPRLRLYYNHIENIPANISASCLDCGRSLSSIGAHHDLFLETIAKARSVDEDKNDPFAESLALLSSPPASSAGEEGEGVEEGEGEPRDDYCALAFFGQIKNVAVEQADLYVEMLIKPLMEVYKGVDIYFHSYNMSMMTNKRNDEVNVTLDVTCSTHLLLSKIMEVPGVRLRRIEFSDPSNADRLFRPLDYYYKNGNPWPDNRGTSMRNLLRQLYSLSRVTDLWWSHWSRYGAVVYCRPDSLFSTKLHLPSPHLPPSTVLTPEFETHRGYNDRFAIGNPDVMFTYGKRVRWVEQYLNTTNAMLHSERYLKAVMDMHFFRNGFLSGFRFVLLRSNWDDMQCN